MDKLGRHAGNFVDHLSVVGLVAMIVAVLITIVSICLIVGGRAGSYRHYNHRYLYAVIVCFVNAIAGLVTYFDWRNHYSAVVGGQTFYYEPRSGVALLLSILVCALAGLTFAVMDWDNRRRTQRLTRTKI